MAAEATRCTLQPGWWRVNPIGSDVGCQAMWGSRLARKMKTTVEEQEESDKENWRKMLSGSLNIDPTIINSYPFSPQKKTVIPFKFSLSSSHLLVH
jgi:hypothetical protein